MQCKMKKSLRIMPSMCDNKNKLAKHHIFSMFMDLAAEHGHDIGLGADKLAAKGLFWLTVKTKVYIHKLPEMMDRITAVTWPEKPSKIRCNRYYALYDGEDLLVEGKTEWAIIESESGRLFKSTGELWNDIEFCEDKLENVDFDRLNIDVQDLVKLEDYTVRHTDIDIGQHMNNAVYPKIACSCIPTNVFCCTEIKSMEIEFKNPVFEGDRITICCKEKDKEIDVCMAFSDGRTAAVMRIRD